MIPVTVLWRLIAYVATVTVIVGLMRWTRVEPAGARAQSKPAPTQTKLQNLVMMLPFRFFFLLDAEALMAGFARIGHLLERCLPILA